MARQVAVGAFLVVLLLATSRVQAQVSRRPPPPPPPPPITAVVINPLRPQIVLPARGLRILFIGNSYTSANNLPDMIAAMSLASNLQSPFADGQLVGGASLAVHLNQGIAVEKIRQGKWDIVVLQDQSLTPILTPEATLQSALVFNQEIAKAGARTLYFQTWADKEMPQTQGQIIKTYQACVARGVGSAVVPVGRAFQIALAADPTLQLHQNDNCQPTQAGTYLAACVFYASLYGRSPVGLPAQLVRGEHVVANVPPATALLLQQAALAAYFGR